MNTLASSPDRPPRLLIVPGLNDSPPEHWQSWLQAGHANAVRVVQRHWATPNVDRWASRIESTIARGGPGDWIAVAHSFGVLALLRYLVRATDAPIVAALLVAPADPDKFGLADQLPSQALPIPSTVVLSRTDPWLAFAAGQRCAARWGSEVMDLGNAGHINVASGYRTLPLARRWLDATEQRLARNSSSRGAADRRHVTAAAQAAAA